MPQHTILLVEDDEALRDIVQDVLEQSGYDVVPAGNGKQGLEYLETCTEFPALVLLDLMMPIVTGWDLLRRARDDARFAELPIVVWTAVLRDRPSGATAMLKKPVALAALLEVVSTYAGPPAGGGAGTAGVASSGPT